MTRWISGTAIVARSARRRDLEQGGVHVGHHVRGPQTPSQRRDLAEEVAGGHRRQSAVAVVHRHAGRGRAVEDEVRRRRGVAMLDDPCPGRHVPNRCLADEGRPLLWRRACRRRQSAGQTVEIRERGGPDRADGHLALGRGAPQPGGALIATLKEYPPPTLHLPK